jgi:hypothetical protein
VKDLDQLTALANTITRILEAGAQALIEQRSGFPAGGTGGTPSSTSDRTGRLATTRADKGPERSDQDYERTIQILIELEDILNRARPPKRTTIHIPMCRTCNELILRIQMQHNITLELPPTTLVDRQRQGRRITTREINQALHENKTQR